MAYYVYILTNKRNGTLYIGSTTDLVHRVEEHKEETFPGFTAKYHLHVLIYAEKFGTITEARLYEKKLKKWNRFRKIALIELVNPNWNEINPWDYIE